MAIITGWEYKVPRHKIDILEEAFAMNVPNALTYARIFFVLPLMLFLVTSFSEHWLGAPRFAAGAAIFLVGSLTDLLDGWYARKYKQTTEHGKLLDTVADKIFIMAALVALVESHLVPAWAVVAMIGREFVVLALKGVAKDKSPKILGKIKMWAQVCAVLCLILALSPTGGPPQLSNFGQDYPELFFWNIPEVWETFLHIKGLSGMTLNDWQVLAYVMGRFSFWISLILSVISLALYAKDYHKSLNRKPVLL